MRRAKAVSLGASAAMAVLLIAMMASPAHATGMRIDGNGTPQTFWEWVMDLFAPSGESDRGPLIDPNG